MLSIRQRFLLTSVAYLTILASPASAFGPGWGNGNNGGPGRWDDDGGWSGCPWWLGDDDCDNSDDDNSSGSGSNGNTDPAQLGFTPTEVDRYNRIITIHAVLACLVWVFLIPLGGILIRSGLKTPFLVKIHAALQSISYLIYIIAAAMGIYLVRQLSFGSYSMWSDPHTKLGVAILILALFMPVLGLIHHSMYKKNVTQYNKEGGERPGRTIPGYLHLWGGRILILLGIINGGLGIRLASNSPFSSNSKTKIIGYSVGAAIMLLLYIVFVILGERRRSKERRGSQESVRGVPMVTQSYQPVRAVDNDVTVPPTYEQSQSSLPSTVPGKGVETTARYS